MSPIEPLKGSMSPKPRPKISMETEDQENKEEPENKEIVAAATTASGDTGDSSIVDSEYVIKPVRRGVALSQEIHDQYLICKICLEDFKDPKCLDCMHTFCEECIENHVMSESSYKKYSDYRKFTASFLVLPTEVSCASNNAPIPKINLHRVTLLKTPCYTPVHQSFKLNDRRRIFFTTFRYFDIHIFMPIFF